MNCREPKTECIFPKIVETIYNIYMRLGERINFIYDIYTYILFNRDTANTERGNIRTVYPLMQDPASVDISAITAANTLACQRMELFREDAATATSVCKRPKGSKGESTEAPLVRLP